MSTPEPSADGVPLPPGNPWYINRSVALIVAGGVLSGLGDIVFNFSLILWAATEFGRNGSWLITAILIVSTLPQIVAGPIAGTFVDRWTDKAGMLVRASMVIAALILVLNPVTRSSDGLPVGVQSAVVSCWRASSSPTGSIRAFARLRTCSSATRCPMRSGNERPR